MKISFARFQPLIHRLRPPADRIRLQIDALLHFLEENPRIIRIFCLLPLLVTWFAGIHSDRYRSAAHRGMLLSVIFLLASSIVYFIFDFIRVATSGSFVVQALFFTLQMGVSLAYIGFSGRMAYREYLGLPAEEIFLDRLRDRIIESI